MSKKLTVNVYANDSHICIKMQNNCLRLLKRQKIDQATLLSNYSLLMSLLKKRGLPTGNLKNIRDIITCMWGDYSISIERYINLYNIAYETVSRYNNISNTKSIDVTTELYQILMELKKLQEFNPSIENITYCNNCINYYLKEVASL